MKLNCKDGDLAVVVIGCHSGKMVTCMKLRVCPVEIRSGVFITAAVWDIDRQLSDWSGSLGANIEDSLLRPIRNDPGADETLSWCDVPSEVVV